MNAISVPAPKEPLEQYIEKYFAPSDWQMAKAICMAESGCVSKVSPPNTNGTRDYGIFQVNSVHAGKVGGNLGLLLDPETNVRVAAEIKQSSGWGAWSTFQNGAYQRYLK